MPPVSIRNCCHMVRRNVLLLSFFYLIAIVFGTWGYTAHKLHIFPYKIVNRIILEVTDFLEKPKPLSEKLLTHNQEIKNEFDFNGFVSRDRTFHDEGYLLIPRFSHAHGQVVVDLVRVHHFQLVHRWVPDISEIISKAKQGKKPVDLHLTKADFRAVHPILLEDGSLVFSHGEGYLARIDQESRLLWINTLHFHHAIEMGINGNIVALIKINPSSIDYPFDARDDGYAIVSREGEIIETHSIGKILRDNGYWSIVSAFSEANHNDPLHLNDAQPIYEDNGISKRGDIALSMRHACTVAIYRPRDNRIVALKFGPWLFQHDINILPDGRYSIFNNFQIKGKSITNDPFSTVVIWDPVSGEITRPYDEIFKKAAMYTKSRGRGRILPNGDVFVEENNRNRLLRVSYDTIRWEYVNAPDDRKKFSGLLHWSRYYLPSEIPLDWLEKTS